jgi:hypothetical protein
MVMAYQVLGEAPGSLDSVVSEKQANKVLSELRKPQNVDLFRGAAEFIERAGGGSIPSRDRLKRPALTSELIQLLAKDIRPSDNVS